MLDWHCPCIRSKYHEYHELSTSYVDRRKSSIRYSFESSCKRKMNKLELHYAHANRSDFSTYQSCKFLTCKLSCNMHLHMTGTDGLSNHTSLVSAFLPVSEYEIYWWISLTWMLGNFYTAMSYIKSRFLLKAGLLSVDHFRYFLEMRRIMTLT